MHEPPWFAEYRTRGLKTDQTKQNGEPMPTGRELIEMALSQQGAPSFAAVTCYQDILLRDHWEEATDAPWWAWHSPDPETAAKPWIDLLNRTGEDWYMTPLGASAAEQRNIRVEETASGVFRMNQATGERQRIEREPIGGFQPGPEVPEGKPAHGIRDPDALLARMEEVFGQPNPGALEPAQLELPNLLHAHFARERMPIGHISAPWWRCSFLWGFQERMTLVVERPDLIDAACARFMEHCIADVARLKAMGVGLVWLEDCNSDLISPEAFRQFGLERLRPVVEAIREAGMLSVLYFCGKPDDRWDMLLDTGADALALEESKKHFAIDIADVADLLNGRMALFGNLDAIHLMEKGSDAEVKAEIARQCQAGLRNRRRFVMCLGSPLTPRTPLERVRDYCNWTHSWQAGT